MIFIHFFTQKINDVVVDFEIISNINVYEYHSPIAHCSVNILFHSHNSQPSFKVLLIFRIFFFNSRNLGGKWSNSWEFTSQNGYFKIFQYISYWGSWKNTPVPPFPCSAFAAVTNNNPYINLKYHRTIYGAFLAFIDV